MKTVIKSILFLATFLCATAARAEDFWIAQGGLGTGYGTDCGAGISPGFFNNSANWGTGATRISPGDTVHLCGTITDALTFQASGTVGNPIIVIFETGSKFSTTTWTSGRINATTKSYIEVDGGTNGLIEATANGSSPTYANQNNAHGIFFSGVSNCRIHNLTIQNLFVKNTTDSQGTSTGISLMDGSTVCRVDNNIIHDTQNAIYWELEGTQSAMEVDNNEIYNVNWSTAFGANGNITASNIKWHDNEVYDWSNWNDTGSNNFHHNGLFVYLEGGSGASTVTGLKIYNNYLHGNPGGSYSTAGIYLEANSGSIVSPQIFNNVYWPSTSGFSNGFVNAKGTTTGPTYYNNLIGHATGNSGLCLMFQGATAAISKNNIFVRCDQIYFTNGAAIGTAIAQSDFNSGHTSNLAWGPSSGANTTLAAWRTASSKDASSINTDSQVGITGILPLGSPAANAGTNLFNVIPELNRDKFGDLRPSTGAWEMGADEITGGSGFTINFSSLPLFEQIPDQYIQAAANIHMMWFDRSVGGNLLEGLVCLQNATDEAAPSSCKRWDHTGTLNGMDIFNASPSDVNWSRAGGYPSSNWSFYFEPGFGAPNEMPCTNSTGLWGTLGACWEQGVLASSSAILNANSVLSWQFSYLSVDTTSDINSGSVGFFANGSNYDIFNLETFAAANPTKTFILWTTSLARESPAVASTFNAAMRAYAQANNKILFDFADIESRAPLGSATPGANCYDTRDGQTYSTGTQTENLADDGLNTESICQHYTSETQGGHLGNVSAGKIAVAKGLWILMACVAGWDGCGQTPPPPPTGTLSFTPSSHDYGTIVSGASSAPFDFTVTNTGGTTVTFSSFTLTGTHAAQFSLGTDTCDATILASATCTVPVTFSPTGTAGSRTAAVSIASNATGSPHTAALTGGVSQPPGTITFVPTGLSYGAVTVGQNSSLSIVVTNSGGSTLTSVACSITGTHAAQFTITSATCPTSLAAAASTTVTIQFAPTGTTTGARQAALSVASSATGSPHTATLSGTAFVDTGGVPDETEAWPTPGANSSRTSWALAAVPTVSGVTWYRPIEAYIDGKTQLITANRRVYVATARGLVVLDAETGALSWRLDTELPVNPPTVSGGSTFVTGYDHKLYVLNATSGSSVCTFTGALAGYSSSPLVFGNVAYVANRDGKLYAVDTATCTQLWSYTADAPIFQTPAYSNGIVYFAAMDNYGYAVNATSGALVWKTPAKLPGEHYATWWPVAYGNYVVFSAANPYKESSTPGANQLPGLSPGAAFWGTYTGDIGNVSTSNGSDGWTSGQTLIDTENSGMTAPYTLDAYFTAFPHRRLYVIVNKSDGAEPYTLPFILVGNDNGDVFPPMVHPTDGALYMPNGRSGSSIPRSILMGWKPGNQYLRTVGAITNAIDEPQAYSGANDRFYLSLCCDREARSQSHSQTFWSYSTMLDAILPSAAQAEANGYDQMWNFYTYPFLERLRNYYRGNTASRNGIYSHHGHQNPLIPYAFLNASSQRVERMFIHRGNSVIALGPNSNATYQALVPINPVPANSGATLSAAQLTTKLTAEVQKLVDIWTAQSGDARWLKPGYVNDGSQVSPADWSEVFLFRRPADTLLALSRAYPFITGALQTSLNTYMHNYFTRFFSATLVRQTGWNYGQQREWLTYPPEVSAAMTAADSTSGTFVPRSFYAAWKYSLLFPAERVAIYNAVCPTSACTTLSTTAPSSDTQIRNPFDVNDTLSGLYGWMQLYDSLGTNPNASLRSTVGTLYTTVLNARIAAFAKDHPWLGEVDNPTGITGNRYRRQFNLTRNFAYLVDEVANDLMASAQAGNIANALAEYEYLGPKWFVTRDENGFQEAAARHHWDEHSIFRAKAYVAGDSQATLSKYVDAPGFAVGDLFYIENLAIALEAPGEAEPPDPVLTITTITDNRTSYPAGQVPEYSKLELTFDIQNTVATNLNMPYDAAPPTGVPAAWGITVDAEFSPDNFVTTYKAPAFRFRNFDYQVRGAGTQDWLSPTENVGWKARFVMPTAGTWRYRVRATDASGSTVSSAQNVTVVASANPGFVEVATADPRYFEFQDGTLFTALGYNVQDQWDNPILRATSRYAMMGAHGLNYARVWVGPSSIFGSQWNPWYGIQNTYGGYLPNTALNIETGDGINDAGAVTMQLRYPQTNFIDACRFIGGFINPTAIKPSTQYRFRVEYESFSIAGPRNASFANYGLVLKMQNPASGTWHAAGATACYEPGSSNSTGQVISTYGGTSTGVQTIIGNWTSGPTTNFLPPFYISLENVNDSPAATAYIRSVTLYEVVDNIPVGPNLFEKSDMRYQTYFDQRMSFALDKMLEQAEANGVYLQTVLNEINEPICDSITNAGVFGTSDVNNCYGNNRSMTAGRWLQQAWWRYVQGRWGYSPNIAAWEFINEGDPASTRHYIAADEFCEYMKQSAWAINKHLCSTSLWHSFPSTNFWKHVDYPQIDYASLHAYMATIQTGEFNLASTTDTVACSGTSCDTNPEWLVRMELDSAYAHSDISLQAATRNLGMPLFRDEFGLTPISPHIETTALDQDARGVWLHKILWASLDHGAMHQAYWYPININNRIGPDGSAVNGLHEVWTPLETFLADIPLNNGEYVALSPTISNPTVVRAYGQKDVTGSVKRAHLWVDNRKHTWCSVVNLAITPDPRTDCPQVWDSSALTGTITVGGFTNSATVDIQLYQFTTTGALTTSTPADLTASGAGVVTINLSSLINAATTDVGIKLTETGSAPPDPPTITVDPVSLTFPAVRTDATDSEMVELTNDGGSALTIASISVEGADFSISLGDCPISPSTLASMASCTFMVNYGPSGSTGPRVGIVTIASNATDPLEEVDITATAKQAVLTGVGVPK